MNSNIYSKLLNFIVLLGIVVTFMLLLATPLILTAFFKANFVQISFCLIMSIAACIYVCALPYVVALFKLKKICSLIVKNNPFSLDSVKSLKIIAICAFSEIVTFTCCIKYLEHTIDFFKNFVYGGPIIVVTFLSISIGVLCLVLSRLFDAAIKIKEENEFTI